MRPRRKGPTNSNRRRLTACLAAAAFFALHARAQAPPKLRRIGWLTGGSPKSHAKLLEAFREGLREHGWIEGRNITFELRWAHGDLKRVPALAEELVRTNPDVILTAASPINRAMKQATSTIPIVMATGADPVGAGIVASLARPGGNVTGLSGFYEVTPVKMLELAAAVVPAGARVALVIETSTPFLRGQARDELERAVKTFRFRADYLEVGSADDLGRAFAAIGKNRPAIVVIPAGAMVFALGDGIVKQAVELKLALIGPFEEWCDWGALMSYAISLPDTYRRAASYVDKILRGARPGDLPIEQPTRLALAVNVRVAKQLGLAIPAALLARADKVVE